MIIDYSDAAVSALEAQIEYYEREATTEVAVAFAKAVDSTTRLLSGNPHLGRLLPWKQTSARGIRQINLTGFPQILFYVQQGNVLVVVDIIHGARDLENLRRF